MPSFIASCFSRTFLFLISITAIVAGCSHPLPPDEYIAYLNDPAHGLTHTREVNGATITCAYRPTSLQVLQDLTRQPLATPALRDSVIRIYEGKTYCTLSLSRNNNEIEAQYVTDPAAFQQVLSYLNSGIAADTYLATSAHDSVAAFTSLYARQYGATGHSTILLVFDTHHLPVKQGFHFTFRGERLGLGTSRFFFAASDLGAVPAVQYP